MNPHRACRSVVAAFLGGTFLCLAQSPVGSAVGTPGSAQPLDMGAMTVTAHGHETLITQTPGGVGLVHAERIFLEQPLSISDLTRRIPGVSKSGDAHWGAEVNIRGLSRNRIVFLVDGQRINTATDVGIQFGLLLPDDVERIEVLKGPVSELYGSGSLGGVVNVITRKAQFTEQTEIHGGLSLSASSNPDGFSTYSRLSYSDDSFWLFFSGGYRDFNSYDDGSHDAVPHSYAEDEQATLKAGYKWDDANVTEISLRRYDADCIGVPGSEGLPGASRRVVLPKTVMDSISLKHSFAPHNDLWEESSLLFYYQNIERDVSIDRFAYPPAYTTWPRPYQLWPGAQHTTHGLYWNNILSVEDHTMTLGMDAWRWEYSGERRRKLQLPNGSFRVVDDTPMADSNQLVVGLFAEDDWRINDQVSLNAGARSDRVMAESNRLYGPAPTKALLRQSADMDDWSWSAHLGLTWRLAPSWSMTLLGSRAYRVPDIMDRFKYIALTGTSALYGNPDLAPEDSLFLEYGVHYHGDAVSASFSTWINRVDNLVVAAPIANSGNQLMANVDEALLKGLELDAQWRFALGWTSYGCIAWMEGDNQSTDTYLRDNPPLNGLAGLRYEHAKGWWAEWECEGAAKQDHNAPGYNACDAWLTLNARIGYRFALGHTKHAVLLSCTNLANADYVNYLSSVRGNNSALAYNEPGRNYTLAWQMDF